MSILFECWCGERGVHCDTSTIWACELHRKYTPTTRVAALKRAIWNEAIEAAAKETDATVAPGSIVARRIRMLARAL